MWSQCWWYISFKVECLFSANPRFRWWSIHHLVSFIFHVLGLATMSCRSRKFKSTTLCLIGIDLVLWFDMIESRWKQKQCSSFMNLEVCDACHVWISVCHLYGSPDLRSLWCVGTLSARLTYMNAIYISKCKWPGFNVEWVLTHMLQGSICFQG